MAIIYLLLRATVYALTLKATWVHRRAKNRLQATGKIFSELENHCKADEVATGRPTDFAAQFRLMKLYERRDRADLKWKKAANRLARRQRVANFLKQVKGRNLPYAFGLADMAAGLFVFQWINENPERLEMINEWVSQIV